MLQEKAVGSSKMLVLTTTLYGVTHLKTVTSITLHISTTKLAQAGTAYVVEMAVFWDIILHGLGKD
jgi:hypothetical protein